MNFMIFVSYKRA